MMSRSSSTCCQAPGAESLSCSVTVSSELPSSLSSASHSNRFSSAFRPTRKSPFSNSRWIDATAFLFVPPFLFLSVHFQETEWSIVSVRMTRLKVKQDSRSSGFYPEINTWGVSCREGGWSYGPKGWNPRPGVWELGFGSWGGGAASPSPPARVSGGVL